MKKSLQEGFGLGVTEALWKARPVVATRVGGQQDQVEHRRSGLLIDDPADLAAFGGAMNELLANPEEDLELGTVSGACRIRISPRDKPCARPMAPTRRARSDA